VEPNEAEVVEEMEEEEGYDKDVEAEYGERVELLENGPSIKVLICVPELGPGVGTLLAIRSAICL